MSELKCIVVTPERTLRDVSADFVALPLFDGEIGIAPGHSPMIGRLGAGELRIGCEREVERFYIEGGFVEVLGNVVSVLTGRALPSGELDAEVAAERLSAVLAKPAHTPDLVEQRDRAAQQYRAQIRAADRAR
jgi:F-type H+-transporting ATPase subunit epsilon